MSLPAVQSTKTPQTAFEKELYSVDFKFEPNGLGSFLLQHFPADGKTGYKVLLNVPWSEVPVTICYPVHASETGLSVLYLSNIKALKYKQEAGSIVSIHARMLDDTDVVFYADISIAADAESCYVYDYLPQPMNPQQILEELDKDPLLSLANIVKLVSNRHGFMALAKQEKEQKLMGLSYFSLSDRVFHHETIPLQKPGTKESIHLTDEDGFVDIVIDREGCKINHEQCGLIEPFKWSTPRNSLIQRKCAALLTIWAFNKSPATLIADYSVSLYPFMQQPLPQIKEE